MILYEERAASREREAEREEARAQAKANGQEVSSVSEDLKRVNDVLQLRGTPNAV